MKKEMLLCACVISLLSQAQQGPGDDGINYNDLTRENQISFNPFALVFGKFQVEYERGINSNMSVGLTAGAKFSSGIFKVSGLNNSKITTSDFDFKGIELAPEFRWYLQKGVKKYTGFYTGAYYRYRNYKDNITGVYYSSDGGEQPVNVDARISSNTLGLELGYKLPIGNHLFVDFLIAGPGVSFNKLKLDTSGELASSFYKDLSATLKEKYSFLDSINPDFNFSGDGKERKASFTLPALTYGIKVGYSF